MIVVCDGAKANDEGQYDADATTDDGTSASEKELHGDQSGAIDDLYTFTSPKRKKWKEGKKKILVGSRRSS